MREAAFPSQPIFALEEVCRLPLTAAVEKLQASDQRGIHDRNLVLPYFISTPKNPHDINRENPHKNNKPFAGNSAGNDLKEYQRTKNPTKAKE